MTCCRTTQAIFGTPLLGWKGDAHFDALHILSNILIFGGFILLSSAWKVLFDAQRNQQLATTGPYAHVRHPQYSAFVVIMLGFLLQWPTLLTLLMFPVLAWMYVRLKPCFITLMIFGTRAGI